MSTSRRSFFSTLATAVAGFAILPPATTYARIWKAQRPIGIYLSGGFGTAPTVSFLFRPSDYSGAWLFMGETNESEIRGLLKNQQKFLISRDRHPLKFPNPETVWPEPNHKFCLTESQL